MKRVVKASTEQEEELVTLLARTPVGWQPVFKDIPESIAIEIWRAGFKTGKNYFSIENERGKMVQELNRKNMGLDKKESSDEKND